eukprot:TRINITY_DN9129_c0_g1_i1.p1 TRINITY_DN9129_c0_g1~~TRINITY_DN9129_c0_g1_i1.p1  ORF type:complete len:157 (+),score=29.91 TRINITY_DN9129_c0_g1_i1:24-473(+)
MYSTHGVFCYALTSYKNKPPLGDNNRQQQQKEKMGNCCQKKPKTTLNKEESQLAVSGGKEMKHEISDRDENGMKVHEERDTVNEEGTVKTKHKVVTDEDIAEGHVHTEKVEVSVTGPKRQRTSVDTKLIETGKNVRTTTITHQSETRVT